MVAPYLIGIFMEKKDIWYCYSMVLMHFLRSLGIEYLFEGRNKNSGYPYFAFESTPRFKMALSKWNDHKKLSNECKEADATPEL